MRNFKNLARFGLVLAAAYGASPNPITSVVAYGDSYDNGNLGREANGPVTVEQLATDLKVPIIDHAWVGATTGIGNLSDGGGLTYLGNNSYPGMTTTVDADLTYPPANPATKLYVVWGGHNDILVNGQNQGGSECREYCEVAPGSGSHPHSGPRGYGFRFDALWQPVR